MSKICAFIQMYNESVKGNLVRCLENVKQWSDNIVIYDDASTDDSVEIARRYTRHIIQGKENSISHELFHKQELLELALTLNPDWIMWIDCDEILDRNGTIGGLRKLAESSNAEAHSFHEINLWRSQTYARVDTLFNKGWFCRLWKNTNKIKFQEEYGVHLRLYPINIEVVERSDISVIHYGFWDYNKMLVKIGAHLWNRNDFDTKAEHNWILNETECDCYRLPNERFPVENIPKEFWIEPKPRKIAELKIYQELVRATTLEYQNGS